MTIDGKSYFIGELAEQQSRSPRNSPWTRKGSSRSTSGSWPSRPPAC
ncbi:MAG: hypothetical protein MZU95_03370 [Desulfomicrobium escambiense]|nr:hypothetical protein [Desulfomicrobium escambiense]